MLFQRITRMATATSQSCVLLSSPVTRDFSIECSKQSCLLIPRSHPKYKTMAEVVATLSQDIIPGPRNYEPDLHNKMRTDLLKMLPESQDELPHRSMLDSYDSAIIPIASDTTVRDNYITYDGGIRKGRLLEDMDYFAVHLVFKHVLNPRQKGLLGSPLSIVTGLVDEIHFSGSFRSDCDIRMSGHVTWVGKTSAECTLVLEQLVNRDWVKITEALFVLVARDPLNKQPAFINPLKLETEEEKDLFKIGVENKKRRYKIFQDSLFNVPPTLEEQEIVHDFFINTVDFMKPHNCVWFEDAELKNLVVCQPENRNHYNKIFGGFIMKQAFELAWANTYVFGKSRPLCRRMEDILFKAPVEVGQLLYYHSQICYTQDNYIQTRVSAEVVDPSTGKLTVTNVFHFTFQILDREPPRLIPRTYRESMMYLIGRRHFKTGEGE